MRLSINVDSINTPDFRNFLAHMTGGAQYGIGKVNARLNGPEKWAGESEPMEFRTAADAADFLRALADRMHVQISDAPIRHLTEPEPDPDAFYGGNDPELDRLIAEETRIEAEAQVEAAISQSRYTLVVNTAARLISEDPSDNPEYDRALAELCVDILPNLNQDEHKEAMIRVLRKRK